MNSHILDRPVWNSLSTRHSQFAVGGGFARRFAPDVGPLASARDDSAESLTALEELISRADTLILLQADPIVLPRNVDVEMTATGVQMVLGKLKSAHTESLGRMDRLTEADIPAMLGLAKLTQPGPFEKGTPQLGQFWGIKESGRLVAMAGERMKHSGYTEVSGVCVHPDARGRGFARTLSSFVASRIVERGEIPYLHTYATNAAAIQLYESLGFRLRCPVHVAVIHCRVVPVFSS